MGNIPSWGPRTNRSLHNRGCSLQLSVCGWLKNRLFWKGNGGIAGKNGHEEKICSFIVTLYLVCPTYADFPMLIVVSRHTFFAILTTNPFCYIMITSLRHHYQLSLSLSILFLAFQVLFGARKSKSYLFWFLSIVCTSALLTLQNYKITGYDHFFKCCTYWIFLQKCESGFFWLLITTFTKLSRS